MPRSRHTPPKYAIKSTDKYLKFVDNRIIWVKEDYNDYPSKYAAKKHLQEMKVLTGLSFIVDDYDIERVG